MDSTTVRNTSRSGSNASNGLTIQNSDQPPIPYATLRAHPFPVTSTSFYKPSTSAVKKCKAQLLVSGDEGGWCFIWNLSTRRPVMIWKPHLKSIISVQFLSAENQPESESGVLAVTHGRDNKLYIFLVHLGDDNNTAKGLNVKLPLQADPGDAYPSPKLVYEQDVNALNFCSAAFAATNPLNQQHSETRNFSFAVPSTLASENIDIYQLKIDQNATGTSSSNYNLSRLVAGLKPPVSPIQPLFPDSETSRNEGIVMALLMVELPSNEYLLAIGYESGLAAVYKISPQTSTKTAKTKLLYATKCHSQPILSLDLDSTGFNWFMSSSADAKLVQHPLIGLVQSSSTLSQPSQPQSIPSAKSTQPTQLTQISQPKPSQLSQLFKSPHSQPSKLSQSLHQKIPDKVPQKPEPQPEQNDPWGILPLLSYNTKHSGLAHLDIRSDSKIFATAGWDGMIRIFSTSVSKKKESFKCLAVFKGGRQNGITTVAFSGVLGDVIDVAVDEDGPKTLVEKLQDRRSRSNPNLLAAGGKDGRILLYSLY